MTEKATDSEEVLEASENSPAGEADSGDPAPLADPAPSTDMPAVEESVAEKPVVETALSKAEAAERAAVERAAALEAAAQADAEAPDDIADEDEANEHTGKAQPIELVEELIADEEIEMNWFILKVASNRENSIADALRRRVKVEGLERYFGDIIVPTEDVQEYKNGKKRITKRKLYPGYICAQLHVNDDTWFVVRDTPGIGDFTGAAGKPTPMLAHEIERILPKVVDPDELDKVKSVIKFKVSERVRIKEGTFENFEGEVEAVDEANGRVTVVINIFDRPTPVEIEHWHVESV